MLNNDRVLYRLLSCNHWFYKRKATMYFFQIRMDAKSKVGDKGIIETI